MDRNGKAIKPWRSGTATGWNQVKPGDWDAYGSSLENRGDKYRVDGCHEPCHDGRFEKHCEAPEGAENRCFKDNPVHIPFLQHEKEI